MATDYKRFENTKKYAANMEARASARMQSAKKYMDMYELDSSIISSIEKVGDHVKAIVDPSPRVRLQGAKRLLTSTKMAFQIPHDEGTNEVYDKMEALANAMWRVSGKVNGTAPENDLVTTGLIFDQCDILINKTSHYLDAFDAGVKRRQENGEPEYKPPPAARARIKRLVDSTPIIFEVGHPLGSYPEWDAFGLSRYLSVKVVNRQYIADMYGIAAEFDAMHDEVTLMDMWDLEYRTIWIFEEDDDPLVQAQHNLPFIPVVSYLMEGSRKLWANPDEQRQPFLYTMDKAGIWDMNTINLSAMATNVKTFGLIANFIYSGETEPDYDVTGVMGVHKVRPDEKLEPIEMPINGAALQNLMSVGNDLTTQATIYTQTLGQPLGGSSTTYSETALLHQAGRLPLVTIERQVSAAAAEAMWIAMSWLKLEPNKTFYARSRMESIALEAKQIPEHFMFDARLEIDLPQDKASIATVGAQMAKLFGLRYTLENVFGEAQAQKIIEDKASEDVFMANVEVYIRDIMMRQQRKEQREAMQEEMEQQAVMRTQAGAQPQQPGNEQMSMQELPPEMLQAMARGEGMPMMPEQQVQPAQPPVPDRMPMPEEEV